VRFILVEKNISITGHQTLRKQASKRVGLQTNTASIASVQVQAQKNLQRVITVACPTALVHLHLKKEYMTIINSIVQLNDSLSSGC